MAENAETFLLIWWRACTEKLYERFKGANGMVDVTRSNTPRKEVSEQQYPQEYPVTATTHISENHGRTIGGVAWVGACECAQVVSLQNQARHLLSRIDMVVSTSAS